MSYRAINYGAIVISILLGISLIRQCYGALKALGEQGVFIVRPIKYVPTPPFSALGHACGGPKESWITIYESRDGVPLTLYHEQYRNESLAKRELNRRLRFAKRIIADGIKYDEQGRKAGRRVVMMTSNERAPSAYAFASGTVRGRIVMKNSNEQGKEIARIVWTVKESVYEIDSLSLPYALDLEKYKRY